MTDAEKVQCNAELKSNIALQLLEDGLLNPPPKISKEEQADRLFEEFIRSNPTDDEINKYLSSGHCSVGHDRALFFKEHREELRACILEPWEIRPEKYLFKGKVWNSQITEEYLDMPMQVYPHPPEIITPVKEKRKAKMIQMGLKPFLY